MNTRKKDLAVCITFVLMFVFGFLLCTLLPKPRESASERRLLAQMPELSGEAVLSGRFMSQFESHVTDTFPFRDSFRTLKALTALTLFSRKDSHGIYWADGFLAAVEYPQNEDSLSHSVDVFRFICDTYLTDGQSVYLSVIPDNNCFLAPESGHLSMDYDAFEAFFQEKADFAEYITISDLLEKGDYYKTDTHWRQEKIMDVADRLADAMGTSLSQDYRIHTHNGDFYGVYRGQSGLPLAPDSLHYLTGPAINGCSVYDWQNQRKIPVYNLTMASGRDPYEMFLSGSLSLITIGNPNAETDKTLILFRDSFGSSLAPLLTSGYAKITLVDIRYIHPNFLDQFLDFEGSDVLFLYSTLVLNHSETFLK